MVEKKLDIDYDNQKVRLHLFDTGSLSSPAGTLKNRAVTLSHLRRCQCAIFLVNLHDRASFDIAKYLYDEYSSNWSTHYKHNCLLLASPDPEQTGGASRGLISEQKPIDSQSRQSLESTRLQVQDFCRQKDIEYQELNVDADPKTAKKMVETFLAQFCRENANTLANEKKNLTKDDGGSCNLI